MCIIAVKPLALPMWQDDTIETMFNRNPDGAGLMWTEEGKVVIKKGFMKVKDLLKFLHSRNWKDVPVVMHFRIGTAGPNNQLNCHPYALFQPNEIECVCDVGFAHNGILHDYNPPRPSEINDTQVFARTILDHLPKRFMANDAICTLLEHESKGNRLAFLDGKGRIKMLGNWIEDDGYYYSNSSYKPYKPVSWSKPSIKSTTPSYEQYSFLDSLKLEDAVVAPLAKENLELSFDSKWAVIDDGVDEIDFTTDADFQRAITELARKARYVDPDYWESFDEKFGYEICSATNTIIRYTNIEASF